MQNTTKGQWDLAISVHPTAVGAKDRTPLPADVPGTISIDILTTHHCLDHSIFFDPSNCRQVSKACCSFIAADTFRGHPQWFRQVDPIEF